MFDKATHAVDLFAEVVHAWTEHCALQFHGISITRIDGVYAHGVAIGDMET